MTRAFVKLSLHLTPSTTTGSDAADMSAPWSQTCEATGTFVTNVRSYIAAASRPPAAQRRLTVWPIWLLLTLAACSVHFPDDTFQTKSAVVMGHRAPSLWHSPRQKYHARSCCAAFTPCFSDSCYTLWEHECAVKSLLRRYCIARWWMTPGPPPRSNRRNRQCPPCP